MKTTTYYYDTDDYALWWLVSRDEDGDPYFITGGNDAPRHYLTADQMREFSVALWNVAEEASA